MNIEKAFNAIKEWYGEEGYGIDSVVDSPPARATKEYHNQSKAFKEVRGWQDEAGDSGDSWSGMVYFQMASGKWISTSFF